MPAFISRLPIGTKIVGLVTIVLSLMLAAAAYSYVQNRRSSTAMADLTRDLVPLMDTFTRINAVATEQRLHFERALRHYEAAGIANEAPGPGRLQADADRGEAEFKEFRERDAAIVAGFDRAKSAIDDALTKAKGVEEAVALARLQPMAGFLAALHRDYTTQAARVIDELRRGDMTAFRTEQASIDRDEERLEEMLDRTIGELDAFSMAQAGRVGSDAANLQMISAENLSLAALSFFFGVAVAGLITRELVRPIHRLTGSAQAVAGGNLDVEVAVSTGDEVGQLAGAFNEMVKGLKDREKVKETFSKYIDPRVVRHLLTLGSADLDGERRVMTVLFADIVNFSAIAEHLTPQALVKLINAYLTEMSAIIRDEEGVIDKFIGDAIMAYWGPPFVPEQDQALRGCRAAMRCLERLHAFQEQVPDIVGLRTGAPTIEIRVGIATGPMLVGSIGSDESRNFTIMGDAVNLGSRLEGVCRLYGLHCLVSEATRQAIGEAFEFREIDAIAVKGKDEAVRIYEPLGPRGLLPADRLMQRDAFEAGLRLYRQLRWDEAAAAFARTLEMAPDDGAARTFLDRIALIREAPPAAGWDGVWHLTTK